VRIPRSEKSGVTIESVKELLRELGLPTSYLSDQTALTILALADRQPRAGLLPEHHCLADGARIHDILEFVRNDFERKVAENTREAYRKTTLRPLMDLGWVIRHRLSTNDPNTHYRLHGELAELLEVESGAEKDRLLAKLRSTGKRRKAAQLGGDVVVRLSSGRMFTLSPGAHNELEKDVVEILVPAVLKRPSVVYLGDTAPRAGYQDRTQMRRLNLPIDITESLPDVVVYSHDARRLLVVEVVTSTGPITSARLDQLIDLAQGPSRLGVEVEFLTAFPNRKGLRRFVEEIAWGTSVWIAEEPWNLIRFAEIDQRPATEGE
jgi:BsuBI/PstI restriction endonuclease